VSPFHDLFLSLAEGVGDGEEGARSSATRRQVCAEGEGE